MLNFIRGNILKGNWRTVIFIDDAATPDGLQVDLEHHNAIQGTFRFEG